MGRRAKVDEAIEAVYKEMPGKASWLLTPEGPNPDDTIVVGKIKQLRDALVHQLSLPNDTILFPNRESARSGTGHAWGIIVPEFIDAVESAVPRIVEKHGNKKWDPGADEKTPSRGPAAALYSTDIRAEAPTSGSASRRV